MNTIIKCIKENKVELLSVLAIWILALVLRFISMDNFGGAWYDEIFSWLYAKQNTVFQTISTTVNQDVHMPLYFVLLHFWIKLFGDDVETMRWLSYVISIPLIPVSYLLVKNLFNKTCAYFTAIYLAINAFCIYYCLEIRMYCLNLVLSIVIAWAFVKMLENFEKKYIALYIISLSLLFYNFSITPFIAISYLIVGLIYLLIKKREYIVKFVIVNCIVYLLSIFAIYWCIQNVIVLKTTLASFPLDVHKFDYKLIYEFLENFFTFENQQILNSSTYQMRDMIEMLRFPHYLIYVFFPVLIGLFGIMKALFSKNEKFYLFFLPSILFLAIVFVFVLTKQFSLLTRYLTVILPVCICAMAYGIASIRNKIVVYTLFVLFIYFNATGLLFANNSVLRLHKVELSTFPNILTYYAKVQDDDLILDPLFGENITYFIKKGKRIPFCISTAILLKDKNSLKYYFGDDDAKILNRDSVKDYMIDEILKDIPHKNFEDRLFFDYIRKMKKGQRIVFLSYWTYFLPPLTQKGLNELNYKSYNMADFICSKVTRDCLLILNKYLKYVKHQDIQNGGYSVYVFEKE